MSKAFQIKDLLGYYATDTGDIYSRYVTDGHNIYGRIKKLKPNKNEDGYYKVKLRKDGKTYNKFVHRLIAETFIPNPENKPEVNHKNGIKTDNRVSNLEWCSRSENMKHSYKVLGHKGAFFNKRGIKCPFSKIVLQIKDGKVIAEFYGTHEASEKTKICQCSICKCCCGKQKSAGGFQWTYKDNNDKV